MLSREEMEGLTRDLFASLSDFGPEGERNLDRIRPHLAEDLRYRIPFRAEPIAFDTREAFLTMLAATGGVFSSSIYVFGNVIADVAAQTVAIEATSERPLRASGATARFSYVFVFTFRDRLVSEMREYVFSTDLDLVSHAMNLSAFADTK